MTAKITDRPLKKRGPKPKNQKRLGTIELPEAVVNDLAAEADGVAARAAKRVLLEWHEKKTKKSKR